MSKLIDKMTFLIALDNPVHGGPYGGFAASYVIETMKEAVSYIETLDGRLKQAAEDLQRVLSSTGGIDHDSAADLMLLRDRLCA